MLTMVTQKNNKIDDDDDISVTRDCIPSVVIRKEFQAPRQKRLRSNAAAVL